MNTGLHVILLRGLHANPHACFFLSVCCVREGLRVSVCKGSECKCGKYAPEALQTGHVT